MDDMRGRGRERERERERERKRRSGGRAYSWMDPERMEIGVL